jgi:phospholipid/cholesterol/gamma-HCH transport system ATP-binding protein
MAATRRLSGSSTTDVRSEILSFNAVSVAYDDLLVLDRLNFNVRRGEVAGVVALDGRGRTTLVKCAAGLLEPRAGEVLFEGRNVYDMSFGEDQRFRARTAVVLEGGALFANRSIFDNVALPLLYHSAKQPDELERTVMRLLDRTGYNEDPGALPWQVSARGRRLAAFARALVRDPELVLIDRFFESLEAPDWKRLIELILELNVKSGMSFLLVGELDQAIFQVAERVLVLERGRAVGMDFKRALFKKERVKRAFEAGKAELEKGTRMMVIPDVDTPLEAEDSDAFRMTSDSESQPILVVDQAKRKPPSAPAVPVVPRTPGSSDEGMMDSDETAHISPEAAAELMRQVRARQAQAEADASGPSRADRRRETTANLTTVESKDLDTKDGEGDAERTLTLDPAAAAELLKAARARADERVEREAAALERGEPPPGTIDPNEAAAIAREFRAAAAENDSEAKTPPPVEPESRPRGPEEKR